MKNEKKLKKAQIGREYRSKRVLLGLSQGEVSEAIGVHQTLISAFELGEKQSDRVKAQLDYIYNNVEGKDE